MHNQLETFFNLVMAANFQLCVILYLLLLVIISTIPQSSSQSSSPQNIETLYPFSLLPLIPPSNAANDQLVSPPPAPTTLLQPPAAASSSSKKAVGTAISVTVASTLLLSGLLFFLLYRYSRRKEKANAESQGGSPVVLQPNEFARFNGDLKAVIVDENGLDVLYWRKLENKDSKDGFKKQVVIYVKNEEKEEEKRITNRGDGGRRSGLPIQEVPFHKGESSTSQSPVRIQIEDLKLVAKQTSSILPGTSSPLAIPSQTPPPRTKGKSPAPPPPPPPIPPKKVPAPPPAPLPKAVGLGSSSKPPLVPKGMQHGSEQGPFSLGEGASESMNGQVKLKPLHWDKVNADVNHSMVWNKIEGGSFEVDDNLMDTLFGYVATNRKSPKNDKNSSNSKGDKYRQSFQIFILDTRKSQNTAIVLRSFAITRGEIICALTEGQGLDTDILEKLIRIAPTREEQSEILAFDGDPTRLADAESFLYHLLNAIPSAFMRCNAMLFRSNYESEISNFKESLQMLESACKELRTRGIFLKLLEAILKAGNRMNAGTSRGNAQAFNLTALRKLTDMRSTDGRTTLLHFIVEEVVQAEGKRYVVNQNRSFSRRSSENSNTGSQTPCGSASRGEREKEYIMLGLPLVGGLSAKFSNLKKAATMDYDALAKTCTALTARATEIRKLVVQFGNDGGFEREMKTFLDATEEEIKVMKEEQTRVMELVMRTTNYYHAGASKDKDAHPLQLFVIVKDFLGMVDQACVDIARKMQKRKPATADARSSLNSREVKFPLLPPNFLSDKNSSSDSGDSS